MLVLACTVGLGLFVLQRPGAMDHTSTLIRSVALPRTKAPDDIAYQTMRCRQLEAEAALAPDPDARRSDEATLGEWATRRARHSLPMRACSARTRIAGTQPRCGMPGQVT